MLVWKPYKTNHLKESTASGTLDCLVSRLQKHYKMTGCSMKSQSCLIMTEWGARLTFEIQTRQAATYMHALLTDTERRKLETWQRMCTHAHTRMHAHTHTDLAPAAHPPPSTSTLPGLLPYGLAIHATVLVWSGSLLDATVWIMNFTQFTATVDGDTAS